MTLEIVNKRSSALNSAPNANQLEDGEIGINYNADSLALYIKDTNGNIRKIAGAGSAGQYWDLSGNTLSPDSNTYGVDIGSGNIVLNVNGTASFSSKITSAATVSGDGATTLTTKGYVDAAVAGAAGSTNLGIDTRTATTLNVTSSTGTSATVPAATTTEAGLMTDAQFDKLADIAPNAQVNVQSDWTETDTAADSFIQNKPVIPVDLGVLSIVAGDNIELDPETGVGNVTINATGGGGGGASIEVSDDPPGSPSVGDLWWDSSEGGDSNGGRLYLYYTDQWVQTSNIGGGSGGGGDSLWTVNASTNQVSLVDPAQEVIVESFAVSNDTAAASGIAMDGSGDDSFIGLHADNASFAVTNTDQSQTYLSVMSNGVVTDGTITAAGAITAGGGVQASGFICRAGIEGDYGNTFNVFWTSTSQVQIWIDNSQIVTMSAGSYSPTSLYFDPENNTLFGSNLELHLDPDDPSKVLDVKERLLEFQAKIETLEAAKAALEARITTLEGGSN